MDGVLGESILQDVTLHLDKAFCCKMVGMKKGKGVTYISLKGKKIGARTSRG